MDTTALTFALLYALGLNLAGGLLTDVGEWYNKLEKPWFQPPGWAFAPAWTLILGLAGWALYIGLTEAQNSQQYAIVAAAFGGVMDIVQDPSDGVLFDADGDLDDLVQAIERVQRLDFEPEAAAQRAQRFATPAFRSGLQAEIQSSIDT